MISMSRRKISTANQMQWLLFLGMLQYMLMVQPNIYDVFFSQGKSKPAGVSVSSQMKPRPPAIEADKKNVFIHQMEPHG